MRIENILENKEKTVPDGVYVGVKFSRDTQNVLKKYLSENNIENAIPRDKMHCTVIYSRKYDPDVNVNEKLEKPYIGEPEKLEIFKTQSGKNALVLRFKCDKLKNLHNKLMNEYDLSYDFDEYKIHVTLSYDCGDLDIEKLSSVKSLPNIEIDEIYTEELTLDWNGKDD